MTGIDAGRLNKRVTIEEERRTDNGQGGSKTEWLPLEARASVWAEIIGLSGDEALRAGREKDVQTWRVTIRKRDDVSAKNRLKHKGTVYEIKSVLPDPKADDALLLICETGGEPASPPAPAAPEG